LRSWDAVIITASSERQSALYRGEIERRRTAGMLPDDCEFLVVPDPGDRRVGSGTATINALGAVRHLPEVHSIATPREEWKRGNLDDKVEEVPLRCDIRKLFRRHPQCIELPAFADWIRSGDKQHSFRDSFAGASYHLGSHACRSPIIR
jgi:hypothetical protein